MEEYSPYKGLKPTVKHGGGNMLVWGCMVDAGIVNLHYIEGTMNADLYKSILSRRIMPSAAKLLWLQLVFQHNSDPKHTVTACDSISGQEEGICAQMAP